MYKPGTKYSITCTKNVSNLCINFIIGKIIVIQVVFITLLHKEVKVE